MLAPEYLRAEVDRLSFGVKPAEAESAAPPARAVNAGASDSDRCKTVQTEPDRPIRLAPPRKPPKEMQARKKARDGGVEPTTFGSGGRAEWKCSCRTVITSVLTPSSRKTTTAPQVMAQRCCSAGNP